MHTGYSVGFLFSEDRSRVALIRKNRPDWQKGKLNGIGGHIEANELPEDCMEREFFEETGVTIPAEQWDEFCTLIGPDYTVHCYRAFSDKVFGVETKTDEYVGVFFTNPLRREDLINNLHYLIPMALDAQAHCGQVAY